VSSTATAVAPPGLRTDLVVSRLDTPEGPRFVVKDPVRGTFFRMGPDEYALARRLDGTATLDDVAASASAESGFTATAADIAPFVEQLEKRGLLGAPPGGREARRRRRVSGSILYLRFAAFNPDRLLGRLVGWTGFLFTPWFVGGAALLILFASAVAVGDGAAIGEDLAGLWRVESLALIWFTILGSTALHEMSHGLTCKRFGGEVREMGFMLIYFQPAFYCNVTDAHLFPQRSRRLWVTAAGPYCDLVLWALATLAWRVVERDTWVSSLALVLMATCGIRTFFNVNPLIKLDGYYLLSDWLQIANLRQRAFAYVGARLRRPWAGAAAAPDASPRERRIFVLYGLFAGAFSYWLLTSVLLAFGSFLTWKYQAWGFVMVTALVAATFGGRVRSFFSGAGMRGMAKVTLLGGAALGGLALLPVQHTPSGDFELLPADAADVRAGIEGVIGEVFVREGSRVAAGDQIARILDDELRTRLAVSTSRIAELHARLAELRAGPRPEAVDVAQDAVRRAELRLEDLRAAPRPEAVDVAQAAVRRAELRLEHARFVAECTRTCVAAGASSKATLEQDESEVTLVVQEIEAAKASKRLLEAPPRPEEVAVVEQEIDAAKTSRRLLEAGPRPEEIAVVEQQVAQEEAQRRRIEADIERCLVRAPHAGIVTTPRLGEKSGQLVKRGDLIAEVREVDTMLAQVAIPERELESVRKGMAAELRFRALPGRTFTATVDDFAPAALDVGSRDGRVVKVTMNVANPDGLLLPNMTGYARVCADRTTALDLASRGVRRFARLEFWSWW
jgi:multidrug resistance efflux pump